jgi:hypothetical protein
MEGELCLNSRFITAEAMPSLSALPHKTKIIFEKRSTCDEAHSCITASGEGKSA